MNSSEHPARGKLILCPTPIGNLDDITLRCLRTLREADIILCEDTRHTGRLLKHHGIEAGRLRSYHKFNEAGRAEELISWLGSGLRVALCSDAGSPGLSDPGAYAVRAAAARGFDVEALPGPQALVPALTLSGLDTEPFLFLGFLPKKGTQRSSRLHEVAALPYTLVFFETARRLVDTLEDARSVFGVREAAVARELTKLHEEVRRGTLTELIEHFAHAPPRGELVVLVSGRVEEEAPEALEDWVAERVLAGATAKEIKADAGALGFSRNEAYRLAMRHRKD